MPLSKETTDQIELEALAFAEGRNTDNSESSRVYKSGCSYGYANGAEEWAIWKEKAEGYERALSEIAEKVIEYNNKVTGNHQAGNHCRNIAIEALEQFKQ